MCIVIDANCCHHLLGAHNSAKPIIVWVSKQGAIATGGKNLEELNTAGFSNKNNQILLEWRRANKIKLFSAESIQRQVKELDMKKVLSNDEHVLALVRVSGSRLVFTKDKKLKADLRKGALIPRRDHTKTMIYDNEKDQDKLYRAPCCHSPV